MFGGMGIFILLLLLINFRVIGNMPSIENLEIREVGLASKEKTKDASMLQLYYSSSNHNQISKNAINALIAMQDRHFYDHSGFKTDHVADLPFYLLTGKSKYSCTITQQLALNLLANNEHTNHATSVMQECLLTLKLERNFTKQEIIAFYLNTALFADKVYGIENATQSFFGRNAANLSLEEAATLIGMLKGKDRFNPRLNLNLALQRRNLVISMMEKYELISQTEANESINKPIVLRPN